MSPTLVSHAIGQLFTWLLPVVVALTVLKILSKSRIFKGKLGELVVNSHAKLALPSDIYHPFTNLTLTTTDGTTQIDHVFVSRFGVLWWKQKTCKAGFLGVKSNRTGPKKSIAPPTHFKTRCGKITSTPEYYMNCWS